MGFAEEWKEYIAWEEASIAESPRKWLRHHSRHYEHYNRYWHLRLVNLCLEEMMARGKGGSKTANKATEGGWTKYLQVPLGSVSIETVKDAYRDDDEVYDMMNALLSTGHRVSISYNAANDSTIVTLTCRNEDSPNNGFSFSSFAPNWYVGLLIALYKYSHILGAVWEETELPDGARYG